MGRAATAAALGLGFPSFFSIFFSKVFSNRE
jgi:hypothetical protein